MQIQVKWVGNLLTVFILIEVSLIFISGHETTASVLSWSLYSLGKHKDVQEKVYQEVKKVIGDKQYIDG